MGLSLEFITGNVLRLVEALQSGGIEALDDPTVVTRRADLSLHLIPHDLNLLSRAIGTHSDQTVKDVRPSLSALVDNEDCGALAVAPEWVAYAAAVGLEQIDAVVETWFAMMREEHNEPDLHVTPEALTAVTELVSLCKYALQTNQYIIHIWFL